MRSNRLDRVVPGLIQIRLFTFTCFWSVKSLISLDMVVGTLFCACNRGRGD